MKILAKREIRRIRTRAKIFGTKEIPRLSVYVSNKHIFAQLIDDEKGETLAESSDTKKSFKGKGKKTDIAKEVGKDLAKKAKEKKIEKVVFDKGFRLYHGRVRALAEGAREEGLQF